MHENDYLNELRAGKQLRIKYNNKNYDGCDDEGWWSEELLMYDRAIDLFKCYYPKSSYEKDFCTCHTEREKPRVLSEMQFGVLSMKMVMLL